MPKIKIVCEICNKIFYVYRYRKDTARFCSGSCRAYWVGSERRKNVKPTLSSQGYYFIKVHGHYRANKQGYVKIADLVLEIKLGRRLKKNEIAHHINKNKTDDSPENLQLQIVGQHESLHANKKAINNRICKICGKQFHRTGRKQIPKYCSRKCMIQAFKHRYKIKCLYCRKEFEITNSSKQKYCSRICFMTVWQKNNI